MKATVEYVQRKFTEFNDLCFGGSLPAVPIRLSNAKTFMGKLAYKRRRTLFGKVEAYDYQLRINTRIDMSEAELEDTIIHEMIHYYILVNGIKDSSSHGKVFRSMMAQINSKHGRHITISHKLSEAQKVEAAGAPRWNLIALVYFKDGRMGFKVLPKTQRALNIYKRSMSRVREVSKVEFYWSKDTFFNNYPRSTALKVYFATEDITGKLERRV